APDRLQPATAESIQSLLATQAAEHWFDDRLALAENSARLAMLHHEAKRIPLFILGIAFDTPSLCRFRTVRGDPAARATRRTNPPRARRFGASPRVPGSRRVFPKGQCPWRCHGGEAGLPRLSPGIVRCVPGPV